MAVVSETTVRLKELLLLRWLARNVRHRRERKGLTLQAAAVRGGMHWRHWQKVESGEVNATIKTLVRLGTALDVDPAALLKKEPRAPRGLPAPRAKVKPGEPRRRNKRSSTQAPES